jgi:NADPH-ferrihemoprotein reductase
VELDLKGTGLKYATADNLYVCAENEEVTVTAVARWLGYDADQWFTLEPARARSAGADAPKPLFPVPCTVRTALSRYCDLTGLPRKELLGHLAHFAGVSSERARLAFLASKDGRSDFAEFVTAQQRSIAELFQAFPSVKLPLDALLQLLPRLQPRAYTIASSSVVAPTRVAVVASVIDHPKPGPDPSRRLRGVATNFMLRCAPPPVGDDGSRLDGAPEGAGARARAPWPTLPVYVRTSTFRLPADATRPVVMVGPGTGIAPMMAFLAERRAARLAGAAVGPTVLFFGCRRREEDYIYREELEAFARDGTLSALHVAFSREQAEKVYVQNLVVAHGADMWRLVANGGGHVYVCGATAMGSEVQAAWAKVARERGNMSKEDADAFVRQLQAEGRYVSELWSS